VEEEEEEEKGNMKALRRRAGGAAVGGGRPVLGLRQPDIWCRTRTPGHPRSRSTATAGLVGAIIGRAEAQVLRLYALYAVLDGVATIRLPHLLAALARRTAVGPRRHRPAPRAQEALQVQGDDLVEHGWPFGLGNA
jgi:hypothetical protein